MKKRLLSFLVAVCLFIPCMFMLTACGKADVTGTYTGYSVSVNDTVWTKEQYEARKDASDLTEAETMLLNLAEELFENNATFEIKDDNTFVSAVREGENADTQTGTWTLDGDKLTLTFDVEDGNEPYTQELTFEDGKLVMTQTFGEMTMKMVLAKN